MGQEFLYIRIIIILAYIQLLNLNHGLQKRLHHNPNIKIKTATRRLPENSLSLNRTQLKVGENEFTRSPNKEYW
jgi:hypothetical protein